MKMPDYLDGFKVQPDCPKVIFLVYAKNILRQSEIFMADLLIDIKNMCNRARPIRGF
jgi:hypothetical protein